jgi:hypothetical protein
MIETEKIVEYEVDSTHLSNTIRHELLFDINKKHFLKPIYSKKSQGKLVYRLPAGDYIEFSLFVSISKNYAHFEILLLHLDTTGIDSKTLYEIKMTYSTIYDIMNDPNAPSVLVDFLGMIPRYHHTAHVEGNKNYQDALTLVEEIKKYLNSKVISQ